MLPSQAAMIFSIAISVRSDAILDPLRMQPLAVSVADWGQIQRSARTFGGGVEFPQLATLGRREHPLTTGLRILPSNDPVGLGAFRARLHRRLRIALVQRL